MFGSLGFTELILILVIVLIIFGAGKLPQLGEGMGKAIKGFKKSVQEADAIEVEAQTAAERQNQANQQSSETAQDPSSVQAGAIPPTQASSSEPVQTSKVSNG